MFGVIEEKHSLRADLERDDVTVPASQTQKCFRSTPEK